METTPLAEILYTQRSPTWHMPAPIRPLNLFVVGAGGAGNYPVGENDPRVLFARSLARLRRVGGDEFIVHRSLHRHRTRRTVRDDAAEVIWKKNGRLLAREPPAVLEV